MYLSIHYQFLFDKSEFLLAQRLCGDVASLTTFLVLLSPCPVLVCGCSQQKAAKSHAGEVEQYSSTRSEEYEECSDGEDPDTPVEVPLEVTTAMQPNPTAPTPTVSSRPSPTEQHPEVSAD